VLIAPYFPLVPGLFSCPWRPATEGRLKSGIRRGFPQLTFAADGS
jgi:hypothetical protein